VRDDDLKTPENSGGANHRDGQAEQRREDDWESFDFDSWGTAMEDSPSTNGRPSIEDGTAGHETAAEFEGDESPGGSWVSRGGILYWDDPGAEDSGGSSDARREARSHWADDSIDLPPGAPDYLRTRSLRAWLLRQRLLETEAIGQLLLERRRHEADREDDQDSSPPEPAEDSPVELALAQRQAAIEVYEALVESLDEMSSHSGPARLLVEFYLWLNERLAILASTAPAPSYRTAFSAEARLAPMDLADNPGDSTETSGMESPSLSARSIVEWQGRAQAALGARRRIEQVSAPEPED
jgi:hypothetical protein